MKIRPVAIMALCLFLIPLLLQPLSTQGIDPTLAPNASKSSSPMQPDGGPPPPSPDYSGIGMARNVAEYANRTDAGQSLHLIYDSSASIRYNDTAQAVLPPGWEGYMLVTYVYDVAENRSWVLNPYFDNTAQYWNGITFDGGSWVNVISTSYEANGHGTGNPAVRCDINGYDRGSGWYSYDPVDYARWNQTIAVPPRGQVLSASIQFDYAVWTDSGWGLGLPFQIYIRIDGTQVYSMGFDNVLVSEQTWTNTGQQPFNPNVINLADGLNVQVGLRYTGDSGTRFSPDPRPRARFDNVFVYINALVLPSDINLKVNGLDVIDDTFGSGQVTEDQLASPWTTSPVIAEVNWTSTPYPPNPDMDMDITLTVDTNLFSQKFSTTLYAQDPFTSGTQFIASSGQNTVWKMYYQLALPTLYWNDHFNLTIPDDWNVTFVSEPQLPTTNTLHLCYGGGLGDGYISIPTTDITNSPDGYWYIKAESHNYVDSAELQIYDGGWTPTSAIRAGNTTRVQARILDGSNNPPSGVSSTQANVTIFEPGGGIYYTELVNPTAAGWVYTQSFYNDGWNTTGGTYAIFVNWDNSTEAGEINLQYTVRHGTSLTPREPIIETFYEDQPLFPKVRYLDVDSDDWLEPAAVVEGNWTTGTISFHYVSGTGYWEAEINALEAGDVGQFWIRVNASKSHYDDAFCFILIDVVAETIVNSPQAAGVYVPWRDNATIQLEYLRKADSMGVTGCVPYLEVTANWTAGYYTITEIGSGWYEIELNSTGPGSLGSFVLNITIYKERYQFQQFYITVTVREILTDLDFTNPTNVYWSQNTSIPLFYNDTDHGGVGIAGALVTCDWGDVYYVTDMYVLTLRTDNIDIGLHTVTITVSKTFYNTRQIIVQFYVNPLPLDLTVTVADPINIIYGENFWVEIYVETIFGDPVTDANVTFSWIGGAFSNTSGPGGYYGTWFSSSSGTIGVHYVTAFVNRTNCAQSFASVVVNVKQIPSFLDTVPPGRYSLNFTIGSAFSLPVNYSTLLGSPVLGAVVTYSVGTLNGIYSEIGGGIYNITIDTTGLIAGSYTIYVTASSPNVNSQSRAISLVLTLLPAALEPETTTYVVYWGLNFTVNIFLRNLFNDTPITGATVEYFWGPYSGTMIANGTPGWYTITLPSTAFSSGSVYIATFAANPPSFEFVVNSATIYIESRPTQLDLVNAWMYFPETGAITWLNISEPWTVPRSDVLYLYFNYTDYAKNTVLNAIGSYSWLLGSGTLTYDDETGFYYAVVNMTQVSPANYYLDVTLSRQNYQTAQILQLPVIVTLVRTEIRGIPQNIQAVTGTAYTFTITLWDLDHNTSIPGSTVTVTIPLVTDEHGWVLTDNGDGTYTLPSVTFPGELTYLMEFRAETGLIYSIAIHQVNVNVALHPIVQASLRLGLIAAIIGIIILITWLAYTRVFAIPWLVRKMRKMSTDLGKGKSTHLSNRDINRIATRPESMETIFEPAYGALGVPIAATVLPAAITIEEREAEDEIIWQELEKLEGLGHDQKLELFEEMKRIPAKDRVWFLEDLKQQMADGTRFGRLPAEPTLVPEGVDPRVHARLLSLEALGPAEKDAVVEQLRGLSKEEQEEVIRALEETERGKE
ncbi:MAG: hypothetical protein ACFE9D_00225 [Promethearchaeota archaeon]